MKIAIVGFGLMGSSLARAVLRADKHAHITAIAHNKTTRDAALELGLCQQAFADVSQVPIDCDWVVLAAPVTINIAIMDELISRIGDKTLITDLGSTKEKISNHVRKHHPKFKRFIPAHPMAGSEKSGVRSGRADLYDGKLIILTPISHKYVDEARELFELIGGRVMVMDDPKKHDEHMGYISHLPHLLSFAFMNIAERTADPKTETDYQDLTGGGFKDFSRIAASDPTMWRDIFLDNQDNILKQLDEMLGVLGDYRTAMIDNDGDTLWHLIEDARDERLRLMTKEEEET